MAPVDKPRQADIGLGDLLRALHQLKPETPSQTVNILRCLGFKSSEVYHQPEPYRSSQGAWNRTHFRKKTPARPAAKFSPRPSLPPTPAAPITLPQEVLPSTLETLPDASTSTPTSLPDTDIEKAPLLELAGDRPPPPPRLSLFPKQTARAITSMAIAQCSEGRDIDIPCLINLSVQRQRLRSIPKLPQTTIGNGCHLLLDFSDTMMPWWEDMRDLIQQFQSLLDPHLCKTFEFEDDPMVAVQWSETKGDVVWRPEHRKPVVVATDLGMIRHPSVGLRPEPNAWVQLAQHCRRVEAPLIAIVPIHPARWPKGLHQWLRIIHWHPATSVAIVKRLLKHELNRGLTRKK